MQGEPVTGASKAAIGRAGASAEDNADDNALMSALLAGDKSALATVYDRHAGLLLAIGLRIVGDRAIAEDVLHDVFLEAWHHAADFDPERGTVRAWLVTRMRSRCLDRRASQARQARLADEVKREAHEPEPGRGFGESEPIDGERVRTQIADLPLELSQVLELAYFEGLSSSEIGTRLGIPTGTVKSRTARAIGLLRERLAGGGEA